LTDGKWKRRVSKLWRQLRFLQTTRCDSLWTF
jgi:hypothetical protein